MNLELKKIIKNKLELLHNENITLKILYDAIESCTNIDFAYNRDIVFDMFFDNESLVTEKNGEYFYVSTHVRFEKYIEKSSFDELIERISDDTISEPYDLSNTEHLQEINNWVEMDYKRFVFHFLKICLQRIDKLNETIADFL